MDPGTISVEKDRERKSSELSRSRGAVPGPGQNQDRRRCLEGRGAQLGQCSEWSEKLQMEKKRLV